MFLCSTCGAVFKRPKVKYGVDLEHFGHPCREEFEACPLCGSDNIDRASQCVACGAFKQEHWMEEGFCPACALSAAKKFAAFVDTLTQQEKDFLNARHYGTDAFV